MKIRNFLMRLTNKFNNFWSNGHHIRAILTILLPSFSLGLLIYLLIVFITAAVGFLSRHYAQLIVVALLLWAFVAWLDKHRAEKVNREEREQEIRERQVYSDRLAVAKTKDATYVAQAKVIFSIAQELAPLGIVPPATLSNIYSPGRTIPMADGTVIMNLYLLQKDCETVNTDLVQDTIQTKIDQRLQAGDIPGIPEDYEYEKRVYSGLVVDMVRDSTGGFVEVYTTLVNDSYCRYCENRELNRYRLRPNVDRRDTIY